MRFRIRYHDSKYTAQVYHEFDECWSYVGSAEGYETKQEAERACILYKKTRESNIEEFIL